MEFVCEICGAIIRRSNNLRRHIREQHSDIRTIIKCVFCRQPFMRKANLRRHIMNRHKLSAEEAEKELKSCMNGKMSDEQMQEAKKPVYVT